MRAELENCPNSPDFAREQPHAEKVSGLLQCKRANYFSFSHSTVIFLLANREAKQIGLFWSLSNSKYLNVFGTPK